MQRVSDSSNLLRSSACEPWASGFICATVKRDQPYAWESREAPTALPGGLPFQMPARLAVGLGPESGRGALHHSPRSHVRRETIGSPAFHLRKEAELRLRRKEKQKPACQSNTAMRGKRQGNTKQNAFVTPTGDCRSTPSLLAIEALVERDD